MRRLALLLLAALAGLTLAGCPTRSSPQSCPSGSASCADDNPPPGY